MCYPRILWLLAIFVFTPITLHAKSSEQLPSGLQAAYQKARHQIEVIEEKGKPTCWRALNTGNHLKVDFDGKGIVARSLKDDWRLSMELTQLGAPGQLKPVNKPSVKINDNRLTYDRGTIKEWYVNDPKGLEQGFTLDKPLAKERLVLEFALGGDVKSQLIDKGKVLQLITPQGKKLRYEGLKAWDAKGRDLNATLGLEENTLQLQVAVADAAYPITIDPWLVEDQKLVASAEGEFGYSVAISGDTVVMGAIGGDNDFGAVYVFTRSGDSWSEQAKLEASDAAGYGDFGSAIAVFGDTVVVGASWYDDGRPGSAYVFARSGGIWSEQAKLTASDAAAEDNFGSSVAVSDNVVVVGAPGEWLGSTPGSAYTFIHDGNTWNKQAKLVGSGVAAGDTFGRSVSIFGDTVVVGAPGNDDGGVDSGAAYVFTYSDGTWQEQARLKAAYQTGRDKFGRSVAISGNTVMVGQTASDVFLSNGSILDGAGFVSFFERIGVTWSHQGSFPGSANYYGFGTSVSISGNIATAADSGSPKVEFFMRNDTEWRQQVHLKASNAANFGLYRNSVSVSGDTIVALGDGTYIYDLSSDTTTLLPENQWRQIILPGDPGVNNSVVDVFGDDISGNYGEDWILFRYDTDSDNYVELKSTDTLSQGVGYWIIQKNESGDAIVLRLPENSTPTPVTNPKGCLDTAKGCFEIPLATEESKVQWNMISYPFDSAESLGDVRILTDSGTCASGCELDAAASQGIVHNQLWTYNGTGYTMVDTSGNLDPWTGYWAATLDSAEGSNPKLLVPKPFRVPSD